LKPTYGVEELAEGLGEVLLERGFVPTLHVHTFGLVHNIENIAYLVNIGVNIAILGSIAESLDISGSVCGAIPLFIY